ncbi:MAG: ATP-NAD kinase family protein [Synergistaceae bacterium]|nr:ATP-NAD kinase family protein [Synergistaceae bacterium]
MKIGFLVNPVAGMGGKVALKGTDGEEILRRAIELGAVPEANSRAETALAIFREAALHHQFYTAAGEMGGRLLSENGLVHKTVFEPSKKTTSDDTKKSVSLMLEAGAEAIIFAGGDGTARDVCSIVGDRIPVIGIPAGVKIHSAVYAKRPKDAGTLVKNLLLGKVKRFVLAEVMDLDEDAFRKNIVNARLYGYMRVPDDREFMQNRKSGSTGSDESESMDVAAYVVKSMNDDEIYLIGSGSTTYSILQGLGINGTLLGVDAVLNRKLAGKDLTESDIKNILSGLEKEKRHLVITVIGGQGHIFGRGNQQLSPDVIRMIPKENITVIANSSKMSALFGKNLIADTGDTVLDEELKGYIPVITGFSKKIMAKVG